MILIDLENAILKYYPTTRVICRSDQVCALALHLCAYMCVCVAIVRNTFKSNKCKRIKGAKVHRANDLSCTSYTQSISLLETAYTITTT